MPVLRWDQEAVVGPGFRQFIILTVLITGLVFVLWLVGARPILFREARDNGQWTRILRRRNGVRSFRRMTFSSGPMESRVTLGLEIDRWNTIQVPDALPPTGQEETNSRSRPSRGAQKSFSKPIGLLSQMINRQRGSLNSPLPIREHEVRTNTIGEIFRWVLSWASSHSSDRDGHRQASEEKMERPKYPPISMSNIRTVDDLELLDTPRGRQKRISSVVRRRSSSTHSRASQRRRK
jgi:hypothetical protein